MHSSFVNETKCKKRESNISFHISQAIRLLQQRESAHVTNLVALPHVADQSENWEVMRTLKFMITYVKP